MKFEIRSTKHEMVRQAVRQAHGPEQHRRTHHPEPGRRANPKYEFSNVQNKLIKQEIRSFGQLKLGPRPLGGESGGPILKMWKLFRISDLLRFDIDIRT